MNTDSTWSHLLRTGTFVGLLLGLFTILGSFLLEGGTLEALFAVAPITIVIGGTIAAGIIGSSLDRIALIPRLIAIAMLPTKYNTHALINQIVNFSVLARRDGIIAIEKHLTRVEHPFMRKMFQVAIDGADPETLRNVAETELDFVGERHNTNIQMFVKLGGYSPTMGIIGTVMGLIMVLGSAGDDPGTLIRHIASAFIATMWGILMANIVWLPIGDKLQSLHDEEYRLMRIIIEGVMGVQMGETPSVIRARLAGALPGDEQDAILKAPLPRSFAVAREN